MWLARSISGSLHLSSWVGCCTIGSSVISLWPVVELRGGEDFWEEPALWKTWWPPRNIWFERLQGACKRPHELTHQSTTATCHSKHHADAFCSQKSDFWGLKFFSRLAICSQYFTGRPPCYNSTTGPDAGGLLDLSVYDHTSRVAGSSYYALCQQITRVFVAEIQWRTVAAILHRK